MSVVIVIEGLDKIQGMLSVPNLESGLGKALDRSSQIWRDETKKMDPVSAKTTGYGAKGIPVDTGRLRQSIQARRVSSVAAEVYTPVEYASTIVEGRGKMPPRPFFDWSLEFGAMEKISVAFAEEILHALAA